MSRSSSPGTRRGRPKRCPTTPSSSSASGKTIRGSMSWDEAFSRRYEEWSAHMTEDVDFYVDLARESGGPLVELAVGSARVAIPVAHATGLSVIGIDTSPAMLEQARAAAAAAGVRL